RASYGIGFIAGAMQRVFHGLHLRRIHVVENVAEGLVRGAVEIRELLYDRRDLREIFELQTDATVGAVPDQLSLGIAVVVHRLETEGADLGFFRVNAVGSQKLANLVGRLSPAI